MYFSLSSVFELHPTDLKGRTSRMLRRTLLIISLLLISGLTTQAKELSCQPSKIGLAIDQRDDFRMNCIKQKSSSLTVSRCLKVADTMEYSINAEEAKLICMFDLAKQITLKECLSTSNKLEYPDTGDQARWECLQRFRKVIRKKECLSVGESMNYPANKHRASVFCLNEISR